MYGLFPIIKQPDIELKSGGGYDWQACDGHLPKGGGSTVICLSRAC